MTEKSQILKHKKFSRNYSLSIAVGIFFCLLFILTIWVFDKYNNQSVNDLIANDVGNLSEAFKKINNTAHILDFRQDKSYIDFLNVEKFAGSLVGPMNLEYPDKWQGPYFRINPTIQEKFYEIVKTKQGYFIVPADGIKLTNNKVIGKDIIFNNEADIESMLKDPNILLSNNKPLAAKIETYLRMPKIKSIDQAADVEPQANIDPLLDSDPNGY